MNSGGKSYTLRGNENNEIGIIPRFAKDLFTSIDDTKFEVSLSVVQIYKEWMFDLLRGDLDINVLLKNENL
jgi:Kinesin motor domain